MNLFGQHCYLAWSQMEFWHLSGIIPGESIVSQCLRIPSDDNQACHEKKAHAGNKRVVMRTVIWKQGPTEIIHGVEQYRGKNTPPGVVVNPDHDNSQENRPKALP